MAIVSKSERGQGGPPKSDPPESALPRLVAEIEACRICRDTPLPGQSCLPHEPRPVIRASRTARLMICSQAPGLRVHNTGLPFNDASGDRLRDWMGVDRETFYDTSRIAIVPMGFCFPGYDERKADLPPRRECRLNWHDRVFALMPQVETILVIGTYARAFHFERAGLANRLREPLADTVRNAQSLRDQRPRLIPLPHPSWRNSGWLRRNPWFEQDILPDLRGEVRRLAFSGTIDFETAAKQKPEQ